MLNFTYCKKNSNKFLRKFIILYTNYYLVFFAKLSKSHPIRIKYKTIHHKQKINGLYVSKHKIYKNTAPTYINKSCHNDFTYLKVSQQA